MVLPAGQAAERTQIFPMSSKRSLPAGQAAERRPVSTFWIDDLGVDFETETGVYVLDDAERHPLGSFGVAVCQETAPGFPFEHGEEVPVHLLFSAIMDLKGEDCVSFKVHPDRMRALIEAAEKLGARRI